MTSMFTSAALVGLCACSFLHKTKGGLDGAPGAPAVTADDKDSPAVKNKLADLAELETLLGTTRWSDYAVKSSRLRSYFVFENGLAKESKREAIIKRLETLDATAYKAFPRLHALVGTGARIVEKDVNGKALEPLVGVLDACDGARDLRTRGALDEKVADKPTVSMAATMDTTRARISQAPGNHQHRPHSSASAR